MVVTYTVQDGKSNYLEGAMVSPEETSPSRIARCHEVFVTLG
jgi:hypothetical protein